MHFVDSFALLSCKLFSSSYFIRTKFLCIKIKKFHMDLTNAAKSSMEVANVPPIVSIFRHALRTFDDSSQKDFTSNLNKLKSMMDFLKAEDFSFDSKLNALETWQNPNKAPCTYIEVFQNEKVNMSIFVLSPGFKMPLHDHPQMHGLLKVISGAVNIKSYSEYPLKSAMNEVDFKVIARHEAARLAQGIHKKRRFFAKLSENRMCKANAETCILTPTVSNYHEIEALSLPAAFFDILSPPYDTLIKHIGPRRCRYYKVINEISGNVAELQETEAPDCFYCDHEPYLGPLLS